MKGASMDDLKYYLAEWSRSGGRSKIKGIWACHVKQGIHVKCPRSTQRHSRWRRRERLLWVPVNGHQRENGYLVSRDPARRASSPGPRWFFVPRALCWWPGASLSSGTKNLRALPALRQARVILSFESGDIRSTEIFGHLGFRVMEDLGLALTFGLFTPYVRFRDQAASFLLVLTAWRF